MFHLILAECPLELVPEHLRKHPAVTASAKRGGKGSAETILDGTYHHAAMTSLPDKDRRGRPDIVHISLLVALGSILNKEGHMRVHVHTINDEFIEIAPETRLPRNLERFKGIVSQLLVQGSQAKEAGFLKLTKDMDITKVIERIRPEKIYVLEDGKGPSSIAKAMREDGIVLKQDGKVPEVVIIIGGFPHGDYRTDLKGLKARAFSIYKEPLETWTVVAGVIGGIEGAMGLPSGARRGTS